MYKKLKDGWFREPYLSITYAHELTGGMNERSEPFQVINRGDEPTVRKHSNE